MKFQFSIRKALQDSWHIFSRHWLFFSVLSLVMIIFNIFSNDHRHSYWLFALVIIAALVWSYVWLSASLAAVDGKEDLLNFKSLSVHMPSLRQFLFFVIISLLVGLIVSVGIILLIIPGIYFLIRLSFATFSYVDHQQRIGKSLEHSWHLVKGKIFWTVLLVLLVEVVLMVVGVIALFIGTLITYPLAMLLVAHLYRSLDTYHRVAEQNPA